MNEAKLFILSTIGIIGSYITTLVGGWNTALVTLIIFMAIDYLTGFIVAGVFKNSPKTPSGTLSSHTGWKGLCKKGMTLLVVLVANRLDTFTGSNFIQNAAIIAYILTETVSIIENAGLMGVPIPNVLTQAIDLLKKKETL